MAQKIGTAEWFKIANDMDGCICPTCQTGKENLALYPDYCPHADSLVIEETEQVLRRNRKRKRADHKKASIQMPIL